MEASCEDFRSGQDYYYEGVVAPSADAEPLEIMVSLTAKNLRGETVQSFKMEKQITPVAPGELMDLSTLKLEREYPTRHEIQRLLDAQEYDEIEWDEKSDD